MIKKFHYSNGTLVPTEEDQNSIQVFVNPDPSERSLLRTTHMMDEHTLSSALDPEEVSRMEVSASHILLIWKRPENYSGDDTFFFNVASMGLLVCPDRLVIITTDDVDLLDSTVRQSFVPRTPIDMALTILFASTHHYMGHLKVIRMIARDLQTKINKSMENKHLIQMFNLSESLVYYLNAINSNEVVLTRLRAHAEKATFPPEVLAIIDDLIIENNQCYKQAEIYSRVLSGLMDARGNIVNNNMNVLLKNLTIINVIFLPLTLVASIGGMSEFSMMTEGIDWRLSYGLFGVAMVVIGFLTAALLKRVDFGGGKTPAPAQREKDRGARKNPETSGGA